MSDIIERSKAALEGITPGQWNCHDFGHAGEDEPSSIVVFSGDFDWQAVRDGDFIASTSAWDHQEYTNARFIAAAPDLVRELVTEVERLRTADEQLSRLAAWWRRCQGDESFRTALNFCAGQLDLALDGQLPALDTTVYQGGKTPHWIS